MGLLSDILDTFDGERINKQLINAHLNKVPFSKEWDELVNKCITDKAIVTTVSGGVMTIGDYYIQTDKLGFGKSWDKNSGFAEVTISNSTAEKLYNYLAINNTKKELKND